MDALTKSLKEDIIRLANDKSAATQMGVVEKLSAHYNATGKGALSAGQNIIAEDIFKMLLAKTEIQVRTLVALNLKESNKLPAALVLQMAKDVEAVAAPVIEFSSVLSDSDLISLIGDNANPEKLVAIAKRKHVSEKVSEALVDTRLEKVVTTLVQNETAKIAEPTFEKIIEEHSSSASVVESLIQRGSVPDEIAEKLITNISGPLKKAMEEKYGSLLEMNELRKIFQQSLEMTRLKLIGLKNSDDQLIRLMRYLDEKGQLSPFSALCMGNYQLFQVSLSRISRIPLKNIQKLTGDKEGLRTVYKQAELPDSMFEIVWLTLRAIHELENELFKDTHVRMSLSPMQVMEKLQQLAEDNGGDAIEGLDYMIGLMQHHLRQNIRYNTGRHQGSNP